MILLPVLFSVCFLLYSAADPCPGGTHQCPHSATCCKLPDEEYGCCPLPDAVCCDDHIHCCPNGYICNDGMCSQASLNFTRPSPKQADVLCPGSGVSCPTNSSCCLNDLGDVIGCCIEPDAVCCPGGQYCCPNNTKCDLQSGLCTDKTSKNEINYLKKIKKSHKPKPIPSFNGNMNTDNVNLHKLTANAALSRYFSVICPGSQFACPDGFTCCQLPQGTWGCCPFANANCCPDRLHCCPHGMNCSPSSQSCERAGVNITSFETLPAMKNGLV